ncbi:sensor histidine kinase [Acetobacter sp.]|uniref:sensor histidine kinase n=1 Tax=Acetobacter sp. TaxID=440 RepID=UPI0039EB9EC3
MKSMSVLGWKSRLLPRTLAARMSLLLIVGFVVFGLIGLSIETHDRIIFDTRFAEHQGLVRAIMIYRTVAEEPPDERDDELERQDFPPRFSVKLADSPDADMTQEMPWDTFQKNVFAPRGERFRPPNDFRPGPGPAATSKPFNDFCDGHANGRLPFPPFHPPDQGQPFGPMDGHGPGLDQCGPRPGEPRLFRNPLFPAAPKKIAMLPESGSHNKGIAFALPNDTRWLVIRYHLPAANPFRWPTFPLALGLMTTGGGLLIVWGVRRLLIPVRTLSAAATAFVPDAASPPLSEDGPLEVAQAAAAFNAMAARIRRFVSERTRILSAIGHDLRTPITRMKLRTEFIEDDEMREKFLADLNELTQIVEATLEFGKDSSPNEQMIWFDLNALLQTVVDNVGESRPQDADNIVLADYRKPVMAYGRPAALKRAFTNLINNAATYGGNAFVTIHPPRNKRVRITIDDNGPGLPVEDLERMFEPFVRGEESRNRETGGTGLGLAISRTIIRGQGGDLVLTNRKPHGLRATATLVAKQVE